MFRIRESKRKGFTLIYVLFIGSVCIFISIICFKISFLQRSNTLKMKEYCCKVEPVQKTREYMLTDLNSLIYKNCTNMNDDSVKKYLSSISGNIVNYGYSHLKYNNTTNSFILVYYLGKKFYKEELYKYNIKNGNVFFNCLDYSFKEGELH